MDLQEYISNQIIARRKGVLANSDQLTLGELILKLEPIAKNQKGVQEKYGHEANVQYDFEHLFPTALDSWRGDYSELALNYQSDGERMDVGEFLQMLKDAIGKEYTGYKGGEFAMGKHTPIWVANYGNSGSTAVIDVVDGEHTVYLITGLREY